MSAIREAIRNLAAFFVLSTILLRLLPGESYARYLRFFLGLILLISLLGPMASALSAESLFTDAMDQIEDAFSDDPGESGSANRSSGAGSAAASAGNQLTSAWLEESIAAASAGEWSAILSVYQEEIQEQINEQIADLGVCVTDISADEGKEILTFVLEKEEVNAAEETATAADGERSAGSRKIEIPVISIFVNVDEESSGGKAEEDGVGSVGESGSEGDAGTGDTVLTDAELTVLARAAIAEYCGIGEEFVEVLLRE